MVGESQSAAMGQSTAAGNHGGGFLRRRRFLIVGLVVAAAMGYLGYTAFMGAATYYLSVGELMARGDAAYGEEVRLMGNVIDGSVEKEAETNTIRFNIKDKDGSSSVPVVYSGVVPDAFKPGSDVVLEGTLSPGGTFEATNLLVKCPSKYEAEENAQPAEATY